MYFQISGKTAVVSFFIGIYLLLPKLLIAQNAEGINHWINISSENDFLGLTVTSDRYYSFGERLDYLFQTKKSSTVQKKFINLRVKLEGHTPDHLRDSTDPKYTRPYFGWVFSSIQWIQSDSKNYFKYGVDVGISGSIAHVGAYQNWYHKKISNGKEVKGWENQTADKLGIQLRLDYKHRIFDYKKHAFAIGSAQTLGNMITSFSPTINYQYNSFAQSYYLPYNYSQTKNGNFAVETEMGFSYEFYNAALQGEFFSQSQRYLEDDVIIKFQWIGSIGLRYTFGHFSIFASNVFNSKRVKNNYYHNYGVLGLGVNW